jgi:hypothetical protein
VKHEALAAKVRAEAADYEAAERVWLKMVPQSPSMTVCPPPRFSGQRPVLGPINSPDGMTTSTPFIVNSARIMTGPAVARKPSGIPTAPEMIIEALTAAAERGMAGMTPFDLLGYVKQKYGPDANNSDVGSTAWRLWKDGRLMKPDPDSPLYGLPRANGSSPDPREADQEMRSGVV